MMKEVAFEGSGRPDLRSDKSLNGRDLPVLVLSANFFDRRSPLRSSIGFNLRARTNEDEEEKIAPGTQDLGRRPTIV